MNAHVLALLAAASSFTLLAALLAFVALGTQPPHRKQQLRDLVRDLRQRI